MQGAQAPSLVVKVRSYNPCGQKRKNRIVDSVSSDITFPCDAQRLSVRLCSHSGCAGGPLSVSSCLLCADPCSAWTLAGALGRGNSGSRLLLCRASRAARGLESATDTRYQTALVSRLSSLQSLSHVRLFGTPWTAARQASLSITNSQRLLRLMSIESVMPSNHLILCRPLLLLPSIFPSIRVFSNDSALHIR